MSERLLELLGAGRGIVCAVGAGGKKTTLYALAGAHPGRVGYTATVFTARFPRRLAARELITERADLPAALTELGGERRVAWARPSEKSGRVAGIDPALVAACHATGFDVTLVKADGARMRSIKAPREDEPILPPEADTVLCLVSASAIGQPLDERVAHRPERVAAVTGLEPGAAITAEAVGRLLAAGDGALQGIPRGARAIAVINAVDDDERREQADAAARAALARTDRLERVVLTSHRGDGDPIVAVVERD